MSLRSMQLFQPVVVLADVAAIESQFVFSKLLSVTIVCGEALGAVSSAPKLQSLEILPPVSVKHSHQSLSGFCAAEILTLPTVELEFMGLSSVFNTLRNITILHVRFDPDPHNLYSSNEAALVLTSLTIPSYGESGEKTFKFPKLRSIKLTYETIGFKEIENLSRTCKSYDWDHDENDDNEPSEWVHLRPLDLSTRDSDWSGSEASEDGESAALDASIGEAQAETAGEERTQALVPTESDGCATVEGRTGAVEESVKEVGNEGNEEGNEEEEEAEGSEADEDSETDLEPGWMGTITDDESGTDSSTSMALRRRFRRWNSPYAPSEASEERPDTDIPFGFYFGTLRAIILGRKNELGCEEIEEVQIVRGKGYETGGFYELEGSPGAAWLARHLSNFTIDESR